MADRLAVAAALREIAALLEVEGADGFKVRAYRNAAGSLEGFDGDLGALVAEARLTELRGIGKALAEKVGELWQTGRSQYLDDLRARLPAGVLVLSQLPDLGPKKALALHQALGVNTVDELRAACEAGAVRAVKGFGEKSEQKILDGIRTWEKREQRVLLVDALELGDELLAHLRRCPEVVRVELAGSLRRRRETVADLDLVVGTGEPGPVMDHLAGFPQVARVEARGETKITVRLASGLQIDLRAVPPGDFATALHHFTGSKAHHVRVRGLARQRGLTISEWGVERIDEPGAKLAIPDEAALYRCLDLPYIPPELREDEGEIEAAQAGDAFADLLEQRDVLGMVHCHTTYSDGKNSIEQMARAAEAMGMRYLTITDHSPSAYYASGVELDRLAKQWDEIARVQETVGIKLLRGTESDILADGALDYPDRVLEKLDVVIASIHSRMKMDEDQMTSRLVNAMRQPIFKIWGHALGRLLNQREPFACRVEEVIDAIAGARAAIEINGDPHRLDLEPRWARRARARGIKFVVSTDAHSTGQLRYLQFSVAMARRAGLRRGDVLNTLDADGFMAAVRPAHM